MTKLLFSLAFMSIGFTAICQTPVETYGDPNAPYHVRNEYFLLENGQKKTGRVFDYLSDFNSFGFATVGIDIKNQGDYYSTGKYGIINTKGEYILDPVYDNIGSISYNSYAEISKNDLYGIVNNRGKIIVPITYKSITTSYLPEFWYGLNSSNQWGVVDLKGKNILDFKYAALSVDEDFIHAKNQEGWGVYDKSGKLIIPHKYDELEYREINNQDYFIALLGTESLILDRTGKILIDKKKNLEPIYSSYTPIGFTFANGEKLGLITLPSKVMIQPAYEEINVISIADKNYFIVKQNKNYGIIDENGTVVIPIKFPFINKDAFGNYLIVSNDGEWDENFDGEQEFTPKTYELIDLKGKRTFPNTFKDFKLADINYTTPVLILEQKDLYGVLNTELKPLINFDYSFLDLDEEKDLYVVAKGSDNDSKHTETYYGSTNHSTGGAWGVLDQNGNIKIPLEYDDIDLSGKGSSIGIAVLKDAKWGWIDEQGKSVVAPKYSDINCSSNWCVVTVFQTKTEKEFKGLIDAETGEELIPIKYDEIDQAGYNSGLFYARLNKKHGIIDWSGKTKIEFADRYIEYADYNNYFRTNIYGEVNDWSGVTGGKFGLMNEGGKQIIPNEYKEISFINDSLVSLTDFSNKQTIFNLFSNKLFLTGNFSSVKDYSDDFSFFTVSNLSEEEAEEDPTNERLGVIDSKGKMLVPMKYPTIDIHPNFFIAVDSSLGGSNLFNLKGEQLLSNFARIQFLNDSTVIVSSKNTFNLYNTNTRKNVFATDYAQIKEIKHGWLDEESKVIIENEKGLKGVYQTTTGNFTIPMKYCDIIPASDDRFIVGTCPDLTAGKKSQYGIISAIGSTILPIQYDNISERNNYIRLKHNYTCIKDKIEQYINWYGDAVEKIEEVEEGD